MTTSIYSKVQKSHGLINGLSECSVVINERKTIRVDERRMIIKKITETSAIYLK